MAARRKTMAAPGPLPDLSAELPGGAGPSGSLGLEAGRSWDNGKLPPGCVAGTLEGLRHVNQDRWVAAEQGGYVVFGVFDGHGSEGEKVSGFIRENIVGGIF